MTKRQKLEKKKKEAVEEVQPLGDQPAAAALLNDAGKDDEERRLESMLFGTKYVPAPLNEHVLVLSDDEEEVEGGGTEFQAVADTDVRRSLFDTC